MVRLPRELERPNIDNPYRHVDRRICNRQKRAILVDRPLPSKWVDVDGFLQVVVLGGSSVVRSRSAFSQVAGRKRHEVL